MQAPRETISSVVRWLPLALLGISLTSCPAPDATMARDDVHETSVPRGPARRAVPAARALASAKPTVPTVLATKPAEKAERADEDADPPAHWGVDATPPSFDPLSPDTLPPELDGDSAPSPEDAPRASVLDRVFASAGKALARQSGPRIASVAKETWIRAEPKRRGRRIGYLRAGSIVHRSEEPVGYDGCKGGWYGIEPSGFVCAEKTATLDLDAPVVRVSRTQPRMDGLPYDYVIARLPGPVFYARVPTPAEQARSEPDLGFHLREAKALANDPSFLSPSMTGAIPSFLVALEGKRAPSLPGLADAPPRGAELSVGQGKPRAGFALLDTFTAGERSFGLTTDLTLIPLDRTRAVRGSTFHGVALDEGMTLPIAFVMKHHTTHFLVAGSGQMVPGDPLDYREAVALTGRDKSGGQWLEAKDGTWLRAEDVRRIDRPHRMPAWAEKGRKWVDVSILRQALVAYEGTEPVYVTLVSTGADGLGDPKKTHSTVQGIFLIHTKHVTVTMDNDDAGDAFDLRDVPFVQYFTEGYALHAAYWHDDFGTPRSHGCVNLAPIDAAWMFGFTTPNVPDGWHAALSLHKGTIVYTHP